MNFISYQTQSLLNIYLDNDEDRPLYLASIRVKEI